MDFLLKFESKMSIFILNNTSLNYVKNLIITII